MINYSIFNENKDRLSLSINLESHSVLLSYSAHGKFNKIEDLIRLFPQDCVADFAKKS